MATPIAVFRPLMKWGKFLEKALEKSHGLERGKRGELWIRCNVELVEFNSTTLYDPNVAYV
jgi:hypothetical protein